MKRYILLPIMLVVLAVPLALSGATVTHTATYDAARLHVGTAALDGVTYCTVSYDGLYNRGDAGAPWLPVEYFKFSVPYNAVNFTVTASTLRYGQQQLSHPVYPRQASDTGSPTHPDSVIYSSDVAYPSTIAWVSDEGMLAGENHVVTVAFMPATYLAQSGNRLLSLAMDVTLTLGYELSDTPNVHPLVRKGASLREKGYALTRSAVVNPDDVATNAVPSPMSQAQFREYDEPLDSVENPDTYIIIATDASLRPLRRLAALKMQEGFGVKMVTVNDVITDPISGIGDSIPYHGVGYSDDAGKLRQYLRHHYILRGTRYALLAGTDVPYRYKEGGGADIYYSDINVDWMTYYDPCGEIAVGRLLGTKGDQFDNYTDKLLRYELNPGNGDYSYLRRGLLIESNYYPFYSSSSFEGIPDCTAYNCMTYEEEFTCSDIIDMIQNNHYGALSTFCSGFPSGIRIYENVDAHHHITYHCLWAIDSVKVAPGIEDSEINNGLNRLNNKDYPMIYISPVGKTIPFSTDNIYNVDVNYGESFTMGKDYGGPIYIGSSSNMYSCGERIFHGFITNNCFIGNSRMGDTFLYAKSRLPVSDHGDIICCENLLGDPAMEVWCDEPQQFENISISRTDNTVIINGITGPGTIISYYDNDGTVGKYETDSSSATLLNVSPNSTIMIRKNNYIPYIAPLILQNTDLEQSQYVFATDVKAGHSVDSGRTAGDVTVKEGVEYEIESSGEVTLAGGFKVELGARLAVQRSSYK